MEKITKGVREISVKKAIDFYTIISSKPYPTKPTMVSLRKLVVEAGGKGLDHRKIQFFIDKCLRFNQEQNCYYFIKLDSKRMENLARKACEYSYNSKLNTKSLPEKKNVKSEKKKVKKEIKPTKTVSILWGLIKWQIN